MSLRDVPLRVDYRTGETNIVDEFYIPCMRVSRSYARAVGYFSSHSLVLAAKGLSALVQHGGAMRLVASPWLEPEDIDSIREGHEARNDVVKRALLRSFDSRLLTAPSSLEEQRLRCLAWLIAEKRLEIRIAVPEMRDRERSLYHEKIGIFTDFEGNSVAFNGSPNETAGGLVTNFESVDVFWSWDDPHGRVLRKLTQFEKLWENETPNLEIMGFPQAVEEAVLRFHRAGLPEFDPESDQSHRHSERFHVSSVLPHLPDQIVLRDYQEDAIKAWFEHGKRGMLVMATGSGKTITALTAAVRVIDKEKGCLVVVGAPYQHLVDQWADESRKFGFEPILAYQATKRWSGELSQQLLDYQLGLRLVVIVITTYDTLCSNVLRDMLARVTGPSLFIADEAHHTGAADTHSKLPKGISSRLGLSATPNRWFDDRGTQAIEEYFGDTVAEYGIGQAIADGRLTPYHYYPHLVTLTDDEHEQYLDLTRRIAVAYSHQENDEQIARLDMLLRERAHLLNTASNKLALLRSLIWQKADLSHTLFYCAPGQLDQVLALLGEDCGFLVHPFTAHEKPAERQRLLKAFAGGQLQALVAIRCLDEGVDVPATKTAYILASSSNPREFIQRRGRILRLAPNKTSAVIHDMLAIPDPHGTDPAAFQVERKLVSRELARFREFASTATNHFQAYEAILPVARRYHLLDF